MQSKNKPAQSPDEAAYVALVGALPCACCGGVGEEVHEFEQGQWFSAVNLCIPCHRGKDGWHGTRQRWQLRKMTMLQAIADTVRAVFRIIAERPPLRAPTRRAIPAPSKPTKLGRPDKIVPRKIGA